MRKAFSRALVVLATSFLLLACVSAQARRSNVDKLATPSVEREIARARELEKGVVLVIDPAVVDYVNRVALGIVANSDSVLFREAAGHCNDRRI